MKNPVVTAFVHKPTSSLTYVVQEPEGPRCAVVDPVLDYDRGLHTKQAWSWRSLGALGKPGLATQINVSTWTVGKKVNLPPAS